MISIYCTPSNPVTVSNFKCCIISVILKKYVDRKVVRHVLIQSTSLSINSGGESVIWVGC